MVAYGKLKCGLTYYVIIIIIILLMCKVVYTVYPVKIAHKIQHL